MNLPQWIFLLAGAAVLLFFALFSRTSLREGKLRAALLCAACLVVFAAAWAGLFFLCRAAPFWLLIPSGGVALFAAFFFFPAGKAGAMAVGNMDEQVDERDVIFAREEYRPGTEQFKKYYAMRPEHRAVDDKLRALPELLAPGGRFYEPGPAKHVARIFRIIEGMLHRVDGEVNPSRTETDAAAMTLRVKTLAGHLGADAVGVAELNPLFVYSHVGRGPEPWGAAIENRHRYAIAFTLEMDYGHVEQAPRLPITEETAIQYLKGAQISIAVADFIRSLGYPARAHMAGSNYQIMLPPVAHDAGLGELGRMGYLISPKHGARIRLGAVTTDLPLVPDRPVVFGVQDFCEKCEKCAVQCPSGAIPRGGKVTVRGVEKWQLDIEKCFHFWRVGGTDCGLCMKVCPYSHPPALVHDLVRAGIRRSPLARTLSVWGDDLFYGRRGNF